MSKRKRDEGGAQPGYKKKKKGNQGYAVVTHMGNRGDVRIPKKLQGFLRTEGNFGYIEKKWFDKIQSNVAMTAAGFVYTLNCDLAQGTSQSTRIGAKINIVSVHLRGAVRWDNHAVDNGSMARLILMIDTQANGDVPAPTQVLSNNPISVYDFNNLTNTPRFRVLKDWYLTAPLGVWNGATLIFPRTKIKFNKKVEIPVMYSSNTGAIAEVRTNNLILLQYTNGADLAHIDLLSRIRYVDC